MMMLFVWRLEWSSCNCYHHLSCRLQYLCLVLLLVTSTSFLHEIFHLDHASTSSNCQQSSLWRTSSYRVEKRCSQSSQIALCPQDKGWVMNTGLVRRVVDAASCTRGPIIREKSRWAASKNAMSSSESTDSNNVRNFRRNDMNSVVGSVSGDIGDDDLVGDNTSTIRHVAYIVDGNGRWALKNNKTRMEGHNIGANVTVEIVKESFNLGIEIVTLYLFSTENWKRSNEEIINIMFLLEKYLRDFSLYLKEKNIRIRVIGQKHRLSDSVQLLLNTLETSQLFNNDINSKNQRTLCLAVSYGGRDDIIGATKRIAELITNKKLRIDDVTEDLFSKFTMTGISK